MPGFESLILGEKTAVVFDIGSAYTKCGFAGESGPRFIFPTEVTLPNGDTKHFMFLKTIAEKRKFLIEFFHHLYYKHLLVNPKDRRVVVVETILCTSEFRELIADVLYNHFEIPSALFAPAHLLSLFTLGLSSALVLDCGFQEAMAIPVYEGYTLLNSWQAGQLGSHAIYQNLEELLKKDATVVNEKGESLPLSACSTADCLLSTEVLEDIVARTAFISPASRAEEWRKWLDAQSDEKTADKIAPPKIAEDAFYYPLNSLSGSKRLLIPSRIREFSVECLFTGDNDQITLATLILKSILSSPIDIRRALAQNIIVIGGTVNIPGFTARLLQELNACLELSDFVSLSALKGEFRIHNPPGEPNYIAWLGGAIFGALESLPGRSLERNAYLEKGELPDWTTAIDTSPQLQTERMETTRH